MAEPFDLFYDMWHQPPDGEANNDYVARMCRDHGISYELWEGQPMADQIKLHNCRHVPEKLPEGFRKR